MFNVPKAKSDDFNGRFREIISDPLNTFIRRHPFAGHIFDGRVTLHNGLKVPISGDYAYYGNFSDVLIINRGVHEPLEEFVFQSLLKSLGNQKVTMLELGAYWGHYSMWLLHERPDSQVVLVEPEKVNLDSGIKNFRDNDFTGQFINDFVGNGHFSVDSFISENNLSSLSILHSDIQGYEVEMLQDTQKALSNRKIDYLFISTHSEVLHREVETIISKFDYDIEVSSSFERHTTSFDGFVFARKSTLPALFSGLKFVGRQSIMELTPSERCEYICVLHSSLKQLNLL